MKMLSFQRVAVYETPSRFYIVGTEDAGQTFNVLKIDRTDAKELSVTEDLHKYSKSQLDDLLKMIGSTISKKSKTDKTTLKAISCRGLVGFVRFLEGYYMILVTKSSRICRLGYHWFYKIEETSMIYVPNEQPKSNVSGEEQRYLRMFQAVDLSTNFYYSYTYDLSRTLSCNIREPCVGYEAKYLWNGYLTEGLTEQNISRRWTLPVIHGYLGCCSVSVKSSPMTIILIARRSCRFAGTRFLKRGANFSGFVANDVETEQIVYDPAVPSLDRGRFTSFVQIRGSVPLFWSQDLTKVVGKPPILIDLIDPFALVPALHFREVILRLLHTYGAPIVVISLAKMREKREHESVLNNEFKTSISYLNQFLDPRRAILFLSFDMARCHKAENVLPKLQEIAYNVVKLNGWFQTFQPLFCHEIRKSPYLENMQINFDGKFVLQNGVPRTNCVDCLDRTNAAQFVIGKVALAYQLHALACLDEPVLNWDTEVCNSLELLYEEHGDTLALQYAGSQLVHSIRTYKKTAIFQERSRDVIQTLSRYYSNTFADYDKQNSLNIFLGVFRPFLNKTNLWDLPTDYWLHNTKSGPYLEDYCSWFTLPADHTFRKYLPYDFSVIPAIERRLLAIKIDEVADDVSKQVKADFSIELTDFDLFYRTFEMSSFDMLLSSTTSLSATETNLQNTSSSETLFAQATKPFWKRSQNVNAKSTGTKDDEDSDSSEEDGGPSDVEVVYSASWSERSCSESDAALIPAQQQTTSSRQLKKLANRKKYRNTSPDSTNCWSWRDSVPTTRQVYGFELKSPNKRDMLKYEQYVKFNRPPLLSDEERNDRSLCARFTRLLENSSSGGVTLKAMSLFTNDSSFGVDLPEVGHLAVEKYRSAIICSLEGPRSPSIADMKIYSDYVASLRVS